MIKQLQRVLTGILCLGVSGIQAEVLGDIRFFQNFFTDAAIATSPYVESSLNYSDFDNGNIASLGVTGGGPLPMLERADIGAELAFRNFDFDGRDSQSGLSELFLTGRYQFDLDIAPQVTGGVKLRIPVGDKETSADWFGFGGFGAVRHAVNPDLVLMGVAGLNSIKIREFKGGATGITAIPNFDVNNSPFDFPIIFPTGTGAQAEEKRKISLMFGGGAIYRVEDPLHIIGEIQIRTEEELWLLSGGADYRLMPNVRLRGMMGIGLDDRTADFVLQGGFLYEFGSS